MNRKLVTALSEARGVTPIAMGARLAAVRDVASQCGAGRGTARAALPDGAAGGAPVAASRPG